MQKIKNPKFYNDPKLKAQISTTGSIPIFNREVRKDVIRSGYTNLLKNIDDANLTLRQVKNGCSIFGKEMMQINYDNPYFSNKTMRNSLANFLHKQQPETKGNSAI